MPRLLAGRCSLAASGFNRPRDGLVPLSRSRINPLAARGQTTVAVIHNGRNTPWAPPVAFTGAVATAEPSTQCRR
jgi:hypothetical protein